MIKWKGYGPLEHGYIGDEFICNIWYPATRHNPVNYYVVNMRGELFEFDTLEDAKAAAELLV